MTSTTWVAFEKVTFSYEQASRPAIDSLTVRFPRGWTGIVGANGAGKTTLLRLAVGELKPDRGRVAGSPRAVYCAQRTDTQPDVFASLTASVDPVATRLRSTLGIQKDWPARWDTLSHGERKRAQVACALWQEPDVLALDEPTNHVDADTRVRLRHALSNFPGAGLLVSHDRALMEGLCAQCLFFSATGVVLRPGSYSQGMEQARREQISKKRARAQAKATFAKLRREETRRREDAAKAAKRRSKRGLHRHDHDARAKIDLARLSGKDGQAGRLLKQMRGRVQQANAELRDARTEKEYRLGISMPGARSPRRYLFALKPRHLPLGRDRHLRVPELTMLPDDRIALTGPNGTGKSTLVRHIMGHLNVDTDRVVYVPQEIDAVQSRVILENALKLPPDRLGDVMTVVSCLNTRPERLIESVMPSPGEVRKLLLAMGLARTPHLIVMDEPTNHMDLPSVECLEEALRYCDCGLLLVSHDETFLARTTQIRWRFVQAGTEIHVARA